MLPLETEICFERGNPTLVLCLCIPRVGLGSLIGLGPEALDDEVLRGAY